MVAVPTNLTIIPGGCDPQLSAGTNLAVLASSLNTTKMAMGLHQTVYFDLSDQRKDGMRKIFSVLQGVFSQGKSVLLMTGCNTLKPER